MTKEGSNLNKYAMHFGTYMGVFWIVKFILFPLGMEITFFQLLFSVLTIAVPFLGYYYTRMFRDKICGGSISFLQAWLFTLLMYLFASLLAGVAHYVYFKFLDHGYLYDSFFEMIRQMEEMNIKDSGTVLNQMKNALDILGGLTPIQLTMQLISLDVFYGGLFALPTALFVMRRPRRKNPEITENNTENN